MPKLLADNTRAKINSPDNSFNFNDSKLSPKLIQNETINNLEMYVPSSGKQIFKTEQPDYIALFTDLYISKDFNEKSSLGRGSEMTYSVETGLDYVLWDLKNEKVAACGKLTQKLKLLDIPTKEDYLRLFEKFAISIIENSPFAVRKIYF